MSQEVFVTQVVVKCRENGLVYKAMRFSRESKDRVFRWLMASPKWSLDAITMPDGDPRLDIRFPGGMIYHATCGNWLVKVNNTDGLAMMSDERFREQFEILDGTTEVSTEEEMSEREDYYRAMRRKGWPSALVKAIEDHFVFAMKLTDGSVIHFRTAEEDGDGWVLVKEVISDETDPEWYLGPPTATGDGAKFDRDVCVRLDQIVWVADCPWGS